MTVVTVQLEQFERAVGFSNDQYSLEEATIPRRKQFVLAIEVQISHVEKALSGSLVDNGRMELNWVKLDDEERDSLVAFLSAPAQFYSEVMSSDNSLHIPSRQKNVPIFTNDHRDMTAAIKDIHEVLPREISSVKSDGCGLVEQLYSHRKPLISGDDQWKIDIGNDEIDGDKNLPPNRVETLRQTTTLLGTWKSTDSLTRVGWFWNIMWKPKSDEHRPSTYDVSNHLNFRSIYLLIQKFNVLTDRSRSYLGSWFKDFWKDGRASYTRPTTKHSVPFLVSST